MKLGALDLGLTNIDIAWKTRQKWHSIRKDSNGRSALDQVADSLAVFPTPPEAIAVTGGRYRDLPREHQGMRLLHVSEMQSIGCGGLVLSGLEKALVVSAGSGSAMVAVDETGAHHATGSAVGGGTLQGLGRLLLGTADALQIDRLALAGNANAADLTLQEAIGGQVGKLPADANAVNFGKLARRAVDLSPEDTAAALVRLIGQVIAVVAINAAQANDLEHIVVIGHLVDLESVRRVLSEVAGYYNASIRVPDNPGSGTAVGAWTCAARELNLLPV